MTDPSDTTRYTRVDLPLYERELRDSLPEHIYDCRVHIGLPGHLGPVAPERQP